MRRILCVAVVMSALSGPALAGMSEGVAAVTVGDYQKAIAEFQPLAAGGDPAAQYQLAKIYLEGRGPADGLPQGIDLMTKAANGNHPEAQAQLGLMYAMGLGVQVDNVQAYDWLSKAMTALPEGTRRTVAEANRDAVLKRMNASQQAAVAGSSAKPAEPAAPAKPAQEAASKPAATTAKPAATTAATTTKTVTEAAATSKPAATEFKAATTTNAAATTAKPATTEARGEDRREASREAGAGREHRACRRCHRRSEGQADGRAHPAGLDAERSGGVGCLEADLRQVFRPAHRPDRDGGIGRPRHQGHVLSRADRAVHDCRGGARALHHDEGRRPRLPGGRQALIIGPPPPELSPSRACECRARPDWVRLGSTSVVSATRCGVDRPLTSMEFRR